MPAHASMGVLQHGRPAATCSADGAGRRISGSAPFLTGLPMLLTRGCRSSSPRACRLVTQAVYVDKLRPPASHASTDKALEKLRASAGVNRTYTGDEE